MTALAQAESHASAAAPETPGGIGRPLLDLPIGVVFAFGSIRLEVERLCGLQAGDLLMLDDDAEAPVLVRVGDRVVARAKLVEKAGDLALELTELLGDDHAAL